MPSVRPRMEIGLRVGFGERGLLAALRIALQFGEHGLQHFVAAQRAAADIGIDVFGLGEMQLLGDFADRLVGQLGAFVGEDLS